MNRRLVEAAPATPRCPSRRHDRIHFRRLADATTLALALVVGFASISCATTPVPRGSATGTPMGDWSEWQTLAPLLQLAEHHVQAPTQEALSEASTLLDEGKFLDADRRLARHADGTDRHWIAVARADVAALHFTRCIRGVAWRLENAGPEGLPARQTDFSNETKLGPGDVSVEALLTNLDAALAESDPALSTQARIARARVAAFASQCAPTPDVAQMAGDSMRRDLATLVAEGHLTPDLSYLWAGVQLQEFSGAAARPFLLQAREGGFDNPGVDYTLATIALEQREFTRVDELAAKASEAFAAIGDLGQQAQAIFVRGEAARAMEDFVSARSHYELAIRTAQGHLPAMLGLTQLTALERGRAHASTYLNDQLLRTLPKSPLDEAKASETMRTVETVTALTGQQLDLAEICRESLLIGIDQHEDAVLRGILYYYAATLEIRLGDYVNARGHGVLARDELADAGQSDLIDIDGFLRHLDAAP